MSNKDEGWQEINLPWYSGTRGVSSFSWLDPYGGRGVERHPLCKPGVLIEVKSRRGEIKLMLIGDINPLGGSCDDCPGIDGDDKVLRAKVVYEAAS